MAKTYPVAIIASTGREDYGHGVDTAWKDIPRPEMLALADDNEQGRAAAAQRTGARTAYADDREMREKEKPESVAVGPNDVFRFLTTFPTPLPLTMLEGTVG